MELDIFSMFLAGISVVILVLVLLAFLIWSPVGFVMGAVFTVGLFWLAYRTDRKDRRQA